MLRSLKKLRPKANKLQSYSANWKRGNCELNMELGSQIESLIKSESFPKPVLLFFEIPAFKRVLKNLKKGSLWKDVYVFTDDDNHPPAEIQKIQAITNAFQKICTLSHYPNFPENSLAKSKLLADNIHDYLFTIFMLEPIKSKSSKQIKKHLFLKTNAFMRTLNKEIASEKRLYSPLNEICFEKIASNVEKQKFCKKDILFTQDVISRLHVCSNKKNSAPQIVHKILNQMHRELEYVFDSSSKNAPFFLPYSLRKSIHEISENSASSKELFFKMQEHFNQAKFTIIETKQESCKENISVACINLQILEKSLTHIAKCSSLKKNFKDYFENFYQKTNHLLQNIGNYNSQISYLLCGFFSAQVSYLLELLNNEEESFNSLDLSHIEGNIISFLERYAKIKPEIGQRFIKKTLLDDKILAMPFNEAKAYTLKNLSLLLPTRNEEIFQTLENDSAAILLDLLEVYKENKKDSYISFLMKEKIKSLYLIDIPSFQLGWYIFGEVCSVLYILSSNQKEDGKELVDSFLDKLYQYPIFHILLQKH